MSANIERLAASGNVALQRYLLERAWAEAFRDGRHDVCRWLDTRRSKPRVRVAMRPTVIDGVMFIGAVRLIGPDGSVRFISRFECRDRLQEAWCAFCDHHLSLLGFDVATLMFRQPPVSGKSGGGFPLTPPPTPALPAASGGRESPASAGFP
jgi:hypothetical protein